MRNISRVQRLATSLKARRIDALVPSLALVLDDAVPFLVRQLYLAENNGWNAAWISGPSGLPVGIQLIGHRNQDHRLLEGAQAVYRRVH